MSMNRFREIRERMSGEEMFAITELARRGHGIAEHHGAIYDWQDIKEDLIIVHAVVGLDLKRMRNATATDLFNDLDGIRQHLDLDTFELRGNWRPQFACDVF